MFGYDTDDTGRHVVQVVRQVTCMVLRSLRRMASCGLGHYWKIGRAARAAEVLSEEITQMCQRCDIEEEASSKACSNRLTWAEFCTSK